MLTRTSTCAGAALAAAVMVMVTALGLLADEPGEGPLATTPVMERALAKISVDSLRGHVAFLASDLLEGRGTPSRGLDLAAEYIAAQYRRAGLEPVGDDGYFQTAPWPYYAPDPGSFSCEVKIAGVETFHVDERQASGSLAGALDIAATPVIKVDASDPQAVEALGAEQVAGKVVLAEVPHPAKAPRTEAARADAARAGFLARMGQLKPAVVVAVNRDSELVTGLRRDRAASGIARFLAPAAPMIQLHSPRLCQTFDALPFGPTEATLSLRVGEFKERTAKVRNVVGLIRGSDPELRDTYVLLTAHYDHLGIAAPDGSGDGIYNGANDDASGAASVVEIASALATTADLRPARSVVFATFYGEEHGLVGSRYYVEHPVVPLDKTVAAINLEQVGRTDDSEGPRVGAATVTGFDYSDVGTVLRRAGAAVGIAVTKHPQKSDAYFRASDNASFARVGIPAHTISVAYQFPDYHRPGDEWTKLDYANMAKVDRMAAAGLLELANGPAPRWNTDNPKTAPFRARTRAAR